MIMTFVRKVKKESKLLTGFPTLNMRLPSLCMQALSLGYSTVWANRAGGQSTIRLWLITSPQERTAFPVNREFLLNLLNSVSLNSIIQGAGHAREPLDRGHGPLLQTWYIGVAGEPVRFQQRQLNIVEITPFAFSQSQRIEFQTAYLRALQRNAMVAGGSQHAFDLMIFALLQHDFQPVRSQQVASHRHQWRRLIVQFHTGQQLRDQFGGDRIVCGGRIDFGNVPLGRRLGVYERPIIRHQQQAGGVVIETAHRLHITPGELFRQDSQHTRVVTGLSGAFKIGRLVQRDIYMPAVNPQLIEYPEHESAGLDSDTVIGNGLPRDAHFTSGNQFTAPLARAKALRLQDAV